MGAIEIFLLAAGGIIFILSFLIPTRKEKGQPQAAPPMAEEKVRELVSREIDAVKDRVDDVVDEAVTYAVEKTERSLERLSNEKIMAINEYSETVLKEIHKNHEEAVFLYDMLNSKHINLKNTVSEVNRTVKEAEETVSSFQKLNPEPVVPPVTVPAAVSSPAPLPAPAPQKPQVRPKAAFVRLAEEQMAKELKEEASAVLASEDMMPKQAKGDSNFNGRILWLYSQGKDKVQIAKELGLGVGEVKLVIDLFEGNETGVKEN